MLEVGKWYFFDRPDGSRQIFLVEDIFYKDGGYKIKSDDYDFTSDGLTINWWKDYSWLPEEDLDVCKPLEKLTPQEAFILLGYGFELFHKNENFIVKLENGDLIHMELDGSNVWKNCFLYRYRNLTIHKAPEKEEKEQ